jgi:hypothetical protein
LQRPPGPAKEDDDEESSDDGEQEVALEATDCARLALAIPATLRHGRLIAVGMALGQLSTAVLMAAASVTGDPWGTCMSADVLDDDCRLHRLKRFLTQKTGSKDI